MPLHYLESITPTLGDLGWVSNGPALIYKDLIYNAKYCRKILFKELNFFSC